MDQANRRAVADFRRECHAAWSDGCNCCLCVTIEIEEQGREMIDWDHWAAMSARVSHGDGWWCPSTNNPASPCYLARTVVGWATWAKIRPRSGWDRALHPTGRPS